MPGIKVALFCMPELGHLQRLLPVISSLTEAGADFRPVPRGTGGRPSGTLAEAVRETITTRDIHAALERILGFA